MKDQLKDLIDHTHGLGIELIKVSGTDKETVINSITEDKSVVVSGSFKNPIHDCIGALPTDMDNALERVRRAFVRVCDGDPLGDLAEGLGVASESLRRLPNGAGDLQEVLDSGYMFN